MHIIVLNKYGKSPKASIRGVGRYTSEVVKIEYDPDYADEEAIRVTYRLTDNAGRTFSYKEIFYNTNLNERTAQFFDYLDDHGVSYNEDTGLPEVVGLREKVVLKKRINYSWPVIVEREFFDDESGDGDELQDH